MKMNLKRPLIFFDLESTGISITHDKIVMLAYIKLYPDGKKESESYYINPGIHIPEESTAIHHIKDEDVKDCPKFKEIAPKLKSIFEGCDLAGFNSNHFDVPMLMEEMLNAGENFNISGIKLIDVQNIYHKLEPRTLSAAYRYYCGNELTDAHSAMADTEATYEVLKAQLDKYPDILKKNVDFLSEFSRVNNNLDLAGRIVYNDRKIPIFNFGKYKGIAVETVLEKDLGYFGWILHGDFPQNTKQILTRLKMKFDNERRATKG